MLRETNNKESLKQWRHSIAKYCAYRERNHKEVRQKLREMGLKPAIAEQLITELIENNFLNEERYAKAYCRGKFLHNNWGKIKIERELKRNRISAYCIRKGMEEIADKEYREVLRNLLIKLKLNHQNKDEYTMKHGISQAAIRKGFEPELVWEFIETSVF
jgi:regulatory protein